MNPCLNQSLEVVITGMGVVSGAGIGLNELALSLKNGTSKFEYSPTEIYHKAVLGSYIDDLQCEKQFLQYSDIGEPFLRAKKCTRRASLAFQSTMLSTLEAWQDARLNKKSASQDRIGIIVAGSNYDQYTHYQIRQKHSASLEYVSPTYSYQYLDTDLVGALSEVFQAKGESFVVGGASASGNVAIIKAQQLLVLDIVDVCLVVGPMTHLSPLEIQALYNVGALGGEFTSKSPIAVCRPFDQEHEGFIYGQGSGCIIMETAQSAENRGVSPRAKMLSGAILLDGNRQTNPNAAGESRAMSKALERALLLPQQVEYINAHGTSSPLGDRTEILAIKQVFFEHLENIWINSTKSIVGHCLNSAGIIEAIATILQIEKGFLHPNLNLQNPIDQSIRFVREQSIDTNLSTAMCNSFGFGGFNTSIILKKGA